MQVALIPLFTIFNKMGLINTYPAIILPQIAFFTVLFHSAVLFIQQILPLKKCWKQRSLMDVHR